MPVVYRCSNCGLILHVFVRVGQNSYGLPTPSELASMYGGRCPRCGKPLRAPRASEIVVEPMRGLGELAERLRPEAGINISRRALKMVERIARGG